MKSIAEEYGAAVLYVLAGVFFGGCLGEDFWNVSGFLRRDLWVSWWENTGG